MSFNKIALETGKVLKISKIASLIKKHSAEIWSFILEKIKDLALNMSLDELPQIYENYLEQIIQSELDNKGYEYEGGKFRISYKSENSFSMSVDLYFVNSEEQWVKESSSSPNTPLTYLNKKSINRIKTEREIVYDLVK